MNGGNHAHAVAAWPEETREAALAKLSKDLSSPHFRSRKRCSEFLRYVVEQASSNSAECLNDRTLGVDLFARSPRYDPNQDPVVRIAAGEVRKRLAQYYLEPEHE